MAPRTIYANLQDGLQPFSLWDQSLADMGSLGVMPCTAVGANAIVLTPIASVNAPNVTIPPRALQAFSFVAAANSTGPVTIKVDGNAPLNLYKMDGVTQATTGDLNATVLYFIGFNAALNGAAGGFQILAPISNEINPIISGATISNSTITTSTYNGNTWTAGTGILTIAALKTLTVNNSLTFTGTDGTSFAFPSTSDTVVTLTATQTLTNKTFNGTTAFGGVPFPTTTQATNFGSTNNQWQIGFFRGLAFGVDSATDYIIGARTADLNISSVSDGTTAHEINLATPGSTAVGTGNLIRRFNLRVGPLGGSVINVFESMTFPNATSFTGADANLPGIGSNGTSLVLRGGTSGGALTLPSSTDVLVGRATTDTFTNKTIDTAGPNTLKVNGVTLSVGQYPGTATNDNATAGNFGEFVSASVASGSAVALTTATAANVTSISLTAGDWDVESSVYFSITSTTSITQCQSSISTTSATIDTGAGNWHAWIQPATVPGATAIGAYTSVVPRRRISLSSTTTVFLVALSNFTASTNAAWGLISARRVR